MLVSALRSSIKYKLGNLKRILDSSIFPIGILALTRNRHASDRMAFGTERAENGAIVTFWIDPRQSRRRDLQTSTAISTLPIGCAVDTFAKLRVIRPTRSQNARRRPSSVHVFCARLFSSLRNRTRAVTRQVSRLAQPGDGVGQRFADRPRLQARAPPGFATSQNA